MSDDIPTLMRRHRGTRILLRLRNERTLQGILLEFDVHLNLTLDKAQDVSGAEPAELGKILLRGDNILAISLPADPEN